jgi:hypothetical protein
MWKEPTAAERLQAQADARRAMLERLKPKPHVPAAEVIPWADREAERVAVLRAKPRARRCVPTVRSNRTVAAPSFSTPKINTAPRAPAPEPIRYAIHKDGVVGKGTSRRYRMRRNKALAQWWKAQQWAAGNRSCCYCDVGLVMRGGHANTASVDHVEPLLPNGVNDTCENFAMACRRCNTRKDRMSAEAFRVLLASERVAMAAE